MEKKTILVVDDTPESIEVIQAYVQEKNYRILRAINGKMACKIAEKEALNLILMDWDMPGMNGIEAIEILKSSEHSKHIPIIMATGTMTSAQNLETAIKAGAIDYVRKPFEKIELLARIHAALEIDQSYKEIRKQMMIIIDQKNRELTTNALNVFEKNKTLIALQEELNTIPSDEYPKLHKQMLKIKELVSSNISSENEWDNFKIHFEQIHSGFFSRLQMEQPELNNNDIRFASYMRIGMSTKEIANILNITTQSVQKARQRLKKKMNLNIEDDLKRYLREL